MTPLFLLLQTALAADPEPAWTDESWRQLYIASTLPDPHVAYAESLGLGFGTGHFYAHDDTGGFAFLEVEGAGLVALGGGLALASANGAWTDADSVLATTGIAALAVGRIVDAITAPLAARRYAAERIRAAGTVK